jgi:hypothetical protein
MIGTLAADLYIGGPTGGSGGGGGGGGPIHVGQWMRVGLGSHGGEHVGPTWRIRERSAHH